MMDQVLIKKACAKWQHAAWRRLPRAPLEPVIWVCDNERLRMYHPALALDNVRTTQHVWTREVFAEIVGALMPQAVDIVRAELAGMRMPTHYYSEYPEIVAAYSHPEDIIPMHKEGGEHDRR